MPRVVRFVLAKMKPGVTALDYERFEREVTDRAAYEQELQSAPDDKKLLSAVIAP